MPRERRLGLLLLATTAACAPACAQILGDYTLDAGCAPGALLPCSCDDGRDGQQRCIPSSGQFEACACKGPVCGDRQADPGECDAEQTYCLEDCCGDEEEELDECSLDSARACPEDCCSGTSCAEVLMGAAPSGICPGAPAQKAYLALVECVCSDGLCQGPCSDSFCGQLPATTECQFCLQSVPDCELKLNKCASF